MLVKHSILSGEAVPVNPIPTSLTRDRDVLSSTCVKHDDYNGLKEDTETSRDPSSYPSLTYAPGSNQVLYGQSPVWVTCDFCHSVVATHITKKISRWPAVVGAGGCMLGLWCCSWIPFCVDDCKKSVHSCPNCQHVLGKGGLLWYYIFYTICSGLLSKKKHTSFQQMCETQLMKNIY